MHIQDKNKLTMMNRRTFLIGLGGLLVASYPVWIERYWIQVNTYDIYLPRLSPVFNNFRLAHLTDIHLGLLTPGWWVEQVVALTNKLMVDVIVCTGDYVKERNAHRQVDNVWSILQHLKAKNGVYSVLGNHDHWADTKRSLFWLDKTGQNIRHQALAITRDQKTLWLGGAGDLWEDQLGIDKAFQNVPPEACKILLTHNPDSADWAYQSEVDLLLAGHTHGGQICLPFYGPLKLPVSNKRYSSGLIHTPKTQMFISRGIGWSIAPIRFNCPPEIAIIRLKSSE